MNYFNTFHHLFMQMTHVTSCNGPTIRPEEMNSEKEKNKKKGDSSRPHVRTSVSNWNQVDDHQPSWNVFISRVIDRPVSYGAPVGRTKRSNHFFFFFFKSEFRLKWRQKRWIAEILWKNSIKSANLHIQIKFTLRVESDVLNTVVNFKSLTFYSKGQKWFF